VARNVREKDFPEYSLDEILTMIKDQKYRISGSAQDTAYFHFGLKTNEEICEVVCLLSKRNFYKSMEAEKKPGLWQDVYKRSGVYIKLQIDGCAVIISFKKDTSFN
jgi:hypothetical protein